MAINLIDKIVPKNDAFTGMVDADQVLGGGDSGTLPDATVAESNVTQHEGAIDHGSITGLFDNDHPQYSLGDQTTTIQLALDGYSLVVVENQRWIDSSTQRQDLRDAADGYVILAGAEGGQIVYGGTESGDDLALYSTSDATKGSVSLGGFLYVDEVNYRVGIGTAAPDFLLEAYGSLGKFVFGNHHVSDEIKVSRLGLPHFTTSEVDICSLATYCDGSISGLGVGGGTGTMNAFTQVDFYTAADTTTLTGTLRMRIDSAGDITVENDLYINGDIWNQSLGDALDGYLVPDDISEVAYVSGAGASSADGYVAFFTGADTIAGDNDFYYNRATNHLTAPNIDLGTWGGTPFVVVLTSGVSYNFASAGSVKIWVIGAGGGGGGVIAGTKAAGAGAAGGVAYKTFIVSGSQTITYSIGAAGAGGDGVDGNAGGDTTATFQAVGLTGGGGGGGDNDHIVQAPGGTYSGGDGGSTGGTGGVPNQSNIGGGGGGGIGAANKGVWGSTDGQPGAQSNDINGLQSVIEEAGYSWTTFGAGSTAGVDDVPGGTATGLGCGGGAPSWWGGVGGDGLYGGGGGGATTYTSQKQGGDGGQGMIVIEVTSV